MFSIFLELSAWILNTSETLQPYLCCLQIRGGEHPGHHLLYEFHSNQTGSSDKVDGDGDGGGDGGGWYGLGG